MHTHEHTHNIYITVPFNDLLPLPGKMYSREKRTGRKLLASPAPTLSGFRLHEKAPRADSKDTQCTLLRIFSLIIQL